MYFVPDGTKECGYYECKKCGYRFLSLQTMKKIACPGSGIEYTRKLRHSVVIVCQQSQYHIGVIPELFIGNPVLRISLQPAIFVTTNERSSNGQ